MATSDLNTQDSADSFETFEAYAASVAPAANKSMISIANTSSTKICKIRSIYLTNVQTTAVTGVMLNFELRRIASHSVGTSITPSQYDTEITLDSGITARTGATVTSEGAVIRRWTYSSDEHGVGAVDVEASDYPINAVIPIFQQEKYGAPIVLRNGQGLSLKQTISSTVGSFDLNIVFTQE